MEENDKHNNINIYKDKSKEICNEKESIKEDSSSMPDISEELANYKSYEFQDDEDIEIQTTTRQKLDAYLSNGIFQQILSITSFLCSLSIYFIYITSTYFPFIDFHWFDILNIIFSIFHILENALYIYLSEHRLIYVLSLDTLIKIFTYIYPFFYFIDNRINKKILEASRSFNLFFVKNFLEENIKLSQNEVIKCITNVIISTIFILLLFASLFRIIEIDQINDFLLNPDTRLHKYETQTQFHQFLYFTVITFSTVGYGDIYPITEGGRILIIILIMLAAYFIPLKTGEILSILKETNVYSRESYKYNNGIPHLIICGNITVESLISFCEELFHEDHGKSEKNVVILNNEEPNQEMKLFIHAGKYEMNIKYLQGNPMDENNLERVDLIKAKAVFILTDKYTQYPDIVDHNNILLALFMKKFLIKKNCLNNNSILYLQLIKAKNKIHYLNGLDSLCANNTQNQDRIIILEQIKMNLLSKSCLFPGIIPLISNLVRSSGNKQKTNYLWLNEYLEGFEQEIYRAELNDKFKNKTFAQISKLIYKIFEAIVFALEINFDGKTMLYLNPGNFYIQKFFEPRNDVKYYIYVICSDKEVANKISRADIMNRADQIYDDNNKEENKNEIKVEHKTKFQQNMIIKLKDIMLLEENSYYNSDNKNENDEYYFKKNIDGNIKKLKKIYKDHIVVCGTHPALYYYLLPLRSKSIGKKNLKDVIILAQNMNKALWESISKFERLILIKGSPLNMEDLHKANIEYASKVVILETDFALNNNYSSKMIDNERIFIYKAIKKLNPNIQIMTELIFESNIEYLLPKEELSHINPAQLDYSTTCIFSSGEVYVNSILDSLTAQAYYNKHIVEIIHLILKGENMVESKLKKILDDIGLISSQIFQCDVPDEFINKNFGELYDFFCEKNLVIIALYRLSGARDNDTGYVFTKPNYHIKITHRDKVFVLGNEKDNKNFLKKKKIKENLFNDKNRSIIKNEKKDNLNENFFEKKNKYSPFNYIREQLFEINKEIDKLNVFMDNLKEECKENITSGIKEEIMSLLQD